MTGRYARRTPTGRELSRSCARPTPTAAAYAAKTWADLRQLTSDLLVDSVLVADIEKPPVAAGTLGRPGMQEPSDRPALAPRGPVFVPFLPIALLWLVL